MNLATKTLATIMLVAMLTLSSVNVGAIQDSGSGDETQQKDRETRQLERLYKRHDRKFEIRASILDMPTKELKEKLKYQSFRQVIKKAGFKDLTSFHTALVGKMKDELRNRGWGDDRIAEFTQKRLERYARNS